MSQHIETARPGSTGAVLALELLRLGGGRARGGRRRGRARLACRRRNSESHRRGEPDEPDDRRDQQRGSGLPRGARDDPRSRRDHGQLSRRQSGVSPPGRGRWRGRDRRSDRDVVRRDLDHQPVGRQRPEPAGGDRYPGDPGAAVGDELVLPQGLLDRLDRTPPPAAEGVAGQATPRPTRVGSSSASACSGSPRSTARASRS